MRWGKGFSFFWPFFLTDPLPASERQFWGSPGYSTDAPRLMTKHEDGHEQRCEQTLYVNETCFLSYCHVGSSALYLWFISGRMRFQNFPSVSVSLITTANRGATVGALGQLYLPRRLTSSWNCRPSDLARGRRGHHIISDNDIRVYCHGLRLRPSQVCIIWCEVVEDHIRYAIPKFRENERGVRPHLQTKHIISGTAKRKLQKRASICPGSIDGVSLALPCKCLQLRPSEMMLIHCCRQNSTEDLYSVLRFINVKPLGDWQEFRKYIMKPIKGGQTSLAIERLQVKFTSW